MRQRIGYCTSADGTRIAYASMGEGEPLVRPSHWLTHLEHDLDDPVWRHVPLGLAHGRRLVRFDARGHGLSQRDPPEISFPRWVEDLEAVVDALDLERFDLIGISQSGATAVEYAARHPERVRRLIVYGGFTRGPMLWSHDRAAQKQRVDLALAMVREGWGLPHERYRQWFTALFLPGGTPEQVQAFNRLQAVSASPQTTERQLAALSEVDVRARLPQVKAPTLVIHCDGDQAVPMFLGQEIAAGVARADFLPLKSPNHLALAQEPAHREFLQAVSRHLGQAPPPRVLPGGPAAAKRVESGVLKLKQNWLVELAAVVTTLAAAATLAWQLWRWLAERG